ncbi:MAG: cation diffusion facilitator family transporter [Methylocystaceae bacterium]
METTVKAALISVLSNSVLVIAKLVVGLMIGSVSVISEAIHSANDLLASFIALFAVKKASRPADEEHNFGHGKIENVSGTIEAILIFVAAAMIIKEAIHKIQVGGSVEIIGWGIAVMGASAGINVFVSAYLLKTAQKTGSIALEADAMHLRTDVYTSLGVLIGLALIKLTGWSLIDPISAILVALLIIKAAYDLTRKAFMPLIDVGLSEKEMAIIVSILKDHEHEYVSYHDLRTRSAGKEIHIDFHLVTRPEMSVQEVHEICDRIEEKILTAFPHSTVVIHVEPFIG